MWLSTRVHSRSGWNEWKNCWVSCTAKCLAGGNVRWHCRRGSLYPQWDRLWRPHRDCSLWTSCRSSSHRTSPSLWTDGLSQGHTTLLPWAALCSGEPLPAIGSASWRYFVDNRTNKTGKLLPHGKYSSKRSDSLRFYDYLCHVIDDFCLSWFAALR